MKHYISPGPFTTDGYNIKDARGANIASVVAPCGYYKDKPYVESPQGNANLFAAAHELKDIGENILIAVHIINEDKIAEYLKKLAALIKQIDEG